MVTKMISKWSRDNHIWNIYTPEVPLTAHYHSTLSAIVHRTRSDLQDGYTSAQGSSIGCLLEAQKIVINDRESVG